MEWIHFGHAMWLATAGDLRILFDPLLDGVHHGGVFEVAPRRTIDVAALRPDFLVVSHQHPDHFDVASLRRLAALDPDTVVFTADPLVARAASRVGFREVRRLDALQRVELSEARLFTTPSFGETLEWGVLVATREGAVWNQVDTVHRGPEDVRATLRAAAGELETESLARGPDLALVRWQPLLEIAVQTAAATTFPLTGYAAALDEIAAVGARAIVPGSAGARHKEPFQAMNRIVYPVSMARAVRDIAARATGSRVYPATVGGAYRLEGGETAYDPAGGAALVSLEGTRDDDRVFRPDLASALVDPNLDARDEASMRGACGASIFETLGPALARAFPSMGTPRPLSFVVEVVFPRAVDAYTIVVAPGAADARIERRFDPDYDALNSIAGSLFADVIAGRRHWGEPLLGGLLRSSLRAYHVGANGLVPANVGPMFLYYGLSYEESMERWVEALLGGG